VTTRPKAAPPPDRTPRVRRPSGAEGGWHIAQSNRTTLGDRHGRHAAVSSWAASSTPATDDEAAEFERALADVPLLQGEAVAALRGIQFEASKRPTSDEMGPPPMGKACDQRYSSATTPALYLCSATTPEDSEAAIRREVAVDVGRQLWVQQFSVSLVDLRVADFSVGAHDPYSYLNLVFDFAERTGSRGTAFSRTVGALVAATFDGMRVAGVQGWATPTGDGFAYANLVLFKPYGRWESWLDRSWPPKPTS